MSPTEILEAMQGKHVAVVGDPIIDEYHFGRVERVCPEAPVPIFTPERTEMRPGGAANVAHQLRALGCHTLELCPERASVKTRFMSGSHMLLRVDRDVTYAPTEQEIADVVAAIESQPVDVVVVSDYDHGWLSTDMAVSVIQAARNKMPVIVDPKRALIRYWGCDLICPTESEIDGGYAHFSGVLLKRGAQGLRLYSQTESYIDIPATARHVYDVTGAGDTVVAVAAAAVAAGASFLEAAQLAALAAGYVVGEVGTTVCPRDKLKELANAS